MKQFDEKFIRLKLMELWKSTFHDSDEYINIIFDNYYNPELSETHWEDGKLISGLIAIPYCFGNSKYKVNALYLCGLATIPESRGQGIMSKLMSRIENKARNLGYTFCFLIPANSGLSLYYEDHGYVPAFYRSKERFLANHNFDFEYSNILDNQKDKQRAEIKRRYWKNLIAKQLLPEEIDNNPLLISKLSSLIIESESQNNNLSILHTPKDINIALKECYISGGDIIYISDSKEVTAIAFINKNDKHEDLVYRIFCRNTCSYYKLMQAVASNAQNKNITLYRYGDEPLGDLTPQRIDEEFYQTEFYEGSQLPAIGEALRTDDICDTQIMHGMCKILNIYEILKFQASTSSALKYSILTHQDFEPFSSNQNSSSCDEKLICQYKIFDGTVSEDVFPISKLKNLDPKKINLIEEILSPQTLARILFQHKMENSMVELAFGIPSLYPKISLMLD